MLTKRLLSVAVISFLLIGSFILISNVDAKAAEENNMTWAGWAREEAANVPVIDGMIETWNQENEEYQVKWLGWPWSETLQQLIIRSRGGQELDLAQIDMGWLATLDKMEVVRDLNPILGEEWIANNLTKSAVEAGNIGGKQLAVPWTSASIGMVYNPDLLEEAGIEKVPETIEEFEIALRKLKEENSDIIPYAMTTKGAGSLGKDFQAWLWTFGGNVFDDDFNVTINNKAGVETLNWMKTLLDDGYIAMDIDRFNARQLFANGVVGFYDDAVFANKLARSNGVEEDQIENKVWPMMRPVIDKGDKPQSVLWGHQLVIFKNAKNEDKAGQFIKHILSKEHSLNYFEETGTVPVSKEAINSEVVSKDKWIEKWLEITAYGTKAETQKFAEQSELHNIITEEVQAALLDSKSPQKALDDAAQRIEGVIR